MESKKENKQELEFHPVKGYKLKGIKRVSEYYRCSISIIQDLVNKGTIPGYRLNRSWYFWSNEIDEALRVKGDKKSENEIISNGN